MKTNTLSALALVLLLSFPCLADTGNTPDSYCKDPASWQPWHELLSKHPEDDAVHALYATRRGLCGMVESGQIDMDRATRIFERIRESLIDRYREQEEEGRQGGKRAM
jgi:hypothetical protein